MSHVKLLTLSSLRYITYTPNSRKPKLLTKRAIESLLKKMVLFNFRVDFKIKFPFV